MHTTPFRRRGTARWALLALAAATAAATLTACGGDQAGSTAAAAQSAAARVSHAEASGTSAAASDTATDSGAGGDSSPCDLVSTQQLASILHHEYTTSSSVGHICYYSGADPADAYSITTFDYANCWALTSQGDGNTPVSGVGDAAVGSSTGLEVEHGSTCIDVGGQTPAEKSGDFSADAAVAGIIIGKLG